MATPEESTSGLLSCKVDELKEKLQGLGLPVHGTKAVLVDRLMKVTEEKSGNDVKKDGDNDEDLEALSIKELRARLARLGLKMTGKRPELLLRLQAAKEGNIGSAEDGDDDKDVSEDDEESEDDDESEDEKKRVDRQRDGEKRHKRHHSKNRGSNITFRDVEDALESFSGDKGENIIRWFKTFEETAEICGWSNA